MRTFIAGEDCQYYLELIAQYKEEVGVEGWAYCRMSNHVHFVVVSHEKTDWRRCFIKCIEITPGMLISESFGKDISGKSAFIHSLWMSGIYF